MAKIGYLHLSDLHIGDKYQKGLISQTKTILFDDIKYILSKIKKLDVVFFTGDFVQKGGIEEFEMLENFLHELWGIFEQNHQNPYLICVPGNHDLERMNDSFNPTQKVLLNWTNETELKKDYFWNNSNDYIKFVNERFRNYLNWYKATSIKKPEDIHWGYIPGDHYCTIIIEGIKLGVVGLNSSFLHLSGGDVKNKIGIYNKQINFLFNENYLEWLKEQNFSVLLTHHNSDWYEKESYDEFYQEIFCENSYIEHLCGHMHEPLYNSTSINGFPAKRYWISPSLFGLEFFNEEKYRIHGYTAGIYDVEPNRITRTIWPRISIRTKTGVLKIIQNDEFNLDKETASLEETLIEYDKNSNIISSVEKSENSITHLDKIEEKTGNLFGYKTSKDKHLVRTIYKEIDSHFNIRPQERNKAIESLVSHKLCWIITKFGLGEDEFIGSILNKSDINLANCFSINCEEVTDIEDLTDLFSKVFSLKITEFFDIINKVDRPLLVFNKLQESVVISSVDLKKFIQTIFDFCPSLKIIIISDSVPDRRFFDSIELLPLDIPAVKQYIEHSQEVHTSFTYIEYEKIHRISSGIPFYLDRLLEQLTFRPLSDISDMEFESSSNYDTNDFLPISIRNIINELRSNQDKQGNRRFSLLAIISLLHNGETFERIKRFDPTKPFYPDDISYLLKNKLVETIQVNSIFGNKQEDSEVIKIIKVPRNVRDYVSSLLTDNDKNDIYKMACNLYLGDNWRNSIKLLPSKDIELDTIIYQNLQFSVRFILLHSLEKDNELEVIRMVRVSLSLIEYFSHRGAYKDAISLAEETLLSIKDLTYDEIESMKIYLTKSLGENLRMSSFRTKAVSILKSICDDERNNISKHERNDIRLSIAYAYETEGNEEEAIKYANMIKKKETDKNSSLYLSAESVIAHFIKNKVQKIQVLNSLKTKADKFGYKTLKANIVLKICKLEKDENQLKQLDKVIIESKNDIYNKVRALVLKSEIILKTKKIEEITESDLLSLNVAYSYTFYQRLKPLLNQCHKLVWQYWEQQNQFDQLLNLFRYSSFVWRLCNDVDEELKYVNILQSNSEFIGWYENNKNNINSTYYNQRIFALFKTPTNS